MAIKRRVKIRSEVLTPVREMSPGENLIQKLGDLKEGRYSRSSREFAFHKELHTATWSIMALIAATLDEQEAQITRLRRTHANNRDPRVDDLKARATNMLEVVGKMGSVSGAMLKDFVFDILKILEGL